MGHDGSVWANSPGFNLRDGEGLKIASLFNDPALAYATGITVNGVKYFTLK
ncbi:unnamed protein product, partial [Rotaria sp. Silwood2]